MHVSSRLASKFDYCREEGGGGIQPRHSEGIFIRNAGKKEGRSFKNG